ncbi:MAG: AAA-like domain-containing protein [Microcoleaceae cyanobacterium]
MSNNAIDQYQYQVGGSLRSNDPHYVVRQADREIYEALAKGEFCYILTCRQEGKSSLLVRTRYIFQDQGYQCSTIDMTRIGSDEITIQQWYKGLVAELCRGFELFEQFNLKTWWQEQAELSLTQRFSNFLEDILLPAFPNDKIIIFLDEIDAILSLKFPIDDFFALIRFCYNQRNVNPNYQRLTFAIFGVATPADLIQDKKRTPFNLGKGIELKGFNLMEAQSLIKGLSKKISRPDTALKAILAWTAGQPFLTQKLCYLLTRFLNEKVITFYQQNPLEIWDVSETEIEKFIANLVEEEIIEHWERKDDPEHLKTIRNRLLYDEKQAGRLLGIYQQILLHHHDPSLPPVNSDDSREQMELILAGLAVRENEYIEVKNRIYQKIFNLDWVEHQLSILRPYSQDFNAWIVSDKKDSSRLLQGQALQEAQTWSQGKSLSDLDYKFLAKSEELDRQRLQLNWEKERREIAEQALSQETKVNKLQRLFLGVTSVALVITGTLVITTFQQYTQAKEQEEKARISEVKAIAVTSEALFNGHQQLPALLNGINAYVKSKNLPNIKEKTQEKIRLTLRRALFGINEYNRLIGHTSGINDLDFSPDGQMIATSSFDKTVKLWSKQGKLINSLPHELLVFVTKFSPDGKIIATAGQDKIVRLWNKEGKLLNSLSGHEDQIETLDFHPDGKIIASASIDGVVKLWGIDGQLIQSFPAHRNTISELSFSPDGKYFATAGGDYLIKIWDLQGNLINTLEDHKDAVLSVKFSPDGKKLASGSGDQTAKLWQVDGKLITTLTGHSGRVWDVDFHPAGNLLATSSADLTVKVWDLEGVELKTLRGHTDHVRAVKFSPDGEFLGSASNDYSVKIWRRSSDILPITKVTGNVYKMTHLAFNADGQRKMPANLGKRLKAWDTQGQLKQTFGDYTDPIFSVAFYYDGSPVTFNPDRSLIAYADNGKVIKFWRPNGTLVNSLVGHTEQVNRVTFSPDGQLLASGSVDKTIKLWQLDGTLQKTISNEKGGIWGLDFSPDGKYLASGSDDNTVKLWDLQGKLIHSLLGHTATVVAVKFSPDGKYLASSGNDKTVKIWDLQGNLLATLPHGGEVWAIAFSEDGQWLVSGSDDHNVRIWDMSSYKLLTILNGHNNRVKGVAISPNKKIIASSSSDQGIILWQVEPLLDDDKILFYACKWVKDYLQNNVEIRTSEKQLCGMNPADQD